MINSFIVAGVLALIFVVFTVGANRKDKNDD